MNELTKKLSRILEIQPQQGYTSVSYAIMRKDHIIAADALGNQGGPEKRPARLSSTYNVASVSKIFCTTAVMQLKAQGRLSLDIPVVRYLPRLYMPDERFKQITLRHCLSHTSGLPGTQWLGFSVSEVGDGNYYDDVYDYLSKNTLKADPGEYSAYCNDGFTLAEMVIAEITGISYSEYCYKNITKPLGLESAHLSEMHSPGHQLVREGSRPAELMLIRGGAGFTMNMSDLCKFGRIFLEPNSVISEEGKREMSSPCGKTFLKGDSRTAYYGMGWDHVNFHDKDISLGEGVLLKKGNSFQFATQFYIVPEHDAVLAISATHDCNLDVGEVILRLFATAMLEEDINLYRSSLPVPLEVKKQAAGLFLAQNCVLKFNINGAAADVMRVKMNGGRECLFNNFRWDGKSFANDIGQRFFFESSGENLYVLMTLKEGVAPAAMQAKSFPEPPKVWADRIGRKYIACQIRPNDIAIRNILSGFSVHELPGYTGVFVLSFSCRRDSGIYNFFDGCVCPVDGKTGRSFINTPSNGSRDSLNPRFFDVDGTEYCDVASYRYRDVSSLKAYAGEGFDEAEKGNTIFSLNCRLEEIPRIPDGRRIIILDENMVAVFDSLFEDKYLPIEKGFIILI